MRLFAFILALMLLAGSVDPMRGWLIALVVVTGLAALRPRWWNWLHVRPAIDLRLASFALAALLLGGAIDPTRDWLIALSVMTGVSMIWPRALRLDLFGHNDDDWHDWRWQRHAARSSARAARGWARWQRRMEGRQMRHSDGWGDDWS